MQRYMFEISSHQNCGCFGLRQNPLVLPPPSFISPDLEPNATIKSRICYCKIHFKFGTRECRASSVGLIEAEYYIFKQLEL